MLLYMSRESVQVARAGVRRECVPRRESGTSGSYSGINISSAALCNARQFLSRRRIARVEVLAIQRLLPRAVNQMSEAAIVTVEPCEGLFRVLQCRTVFHCGEFVDDFAHKRSGNWPTE